MCEEGDTERAGGGMMNRYGNIEVNEWERNKKGAKGSRGGRRGMRSLGVVGQVNCSG